MSTIAVLGTLDSKGHEHAFVAEAIRRQGHTPLLIDVGTLGPPQVAPDVTREQIAAAIDDDFITNFPAMLKRGDRGECVSMMAKAAPILLERLQREGRIDGVISLGGGGGTLIATAAMRALPIGFPKLMVSTLASGNTAHYLGTKDITMMPSIVDVAGLNRISKIIFTRAAGAICGMVDARVGSSDERPLIVASMFGNTTCCINAAIPLLEAAGYEVLVFHSSGAGGRAMEALIESGLGAGALVITTTEWADELVGGTLSAGKTRMDAVAKAAVPSIVVPGCLDMVNFGERESLPQKFENRTLYIHNPQVTLMRTNVEECRQLGTILASKVNSYTAPTTVLIPRKAISVISAEGGPFHDTLADAALFDAIESTLRKDIEVRSLDLKINHPEFAQACVEALLENIAAVSVK